MNRLTVETKQSHKSYLRIVRSHCFPALPSQEGRLGLVGAGRVLASLQGMLLVVVAAVGVDQPRTRASMAASAAAMTQSQGSRAQTERPRQTAQHRAGVTAPLAEEATCHRPPPGAA